MLDSTCSNGDSSITTRVYEPWLRTSIAHSRNPHSQPIPGPNPTRVAKKPIVPKPAAALFEEPVASRLDPLQGRLIAERFRLLQKLGEGQTGTVYRAEQASLGRVCAIKLLAGWEDDADNKLRDHFFRATSLTSRLTSQHTVRIFDFGCTETGQPYIVMELVDGRTLAEVISQGGALSERRTLRITYQICKGLREAHALGLTHRGLGEANVMIADLPDTPDFVKLMDFGIADPENAPAECLLADTRADMRALGVLMVRMLAGKGPREVPADKPAEAALHTLKALYRAGKVSTAIVGIIRRCLGAGPEECYVSVRNLMLALRASVAGHPRSQSELLPITGETSRTPTA